jgi:hypothetical protein
MGVRRGDAGAFFRATAEHDDIATERRGWLANEPARYAGLVDGEEAVLEETRLLADEWASFATPDERSHVATASNGWEKLLRLGAVLEPDLLLLSREADGPMILRAACVCFPSSWRPAEKFGQPMSFIHEPAPGLNSSLGAQIDTFLSRLQPGVGWLRSNWGLSASAERNQHPDRALPRLTPELTLDRVWLRVERQCLVALPTSGGVLFGLRIESKRLDELREQSEEMARRLAHALRTMDDKIAQYKGIAPARDALVARLEA